MKQLLILWLMLFAVACTPATQTSPHVAAPTATDTYDFSGVHLRLHNDTGQNLTDVALIVGEDEEQLGLLPQNAVSNYVTFTAVQQSPTIHVTIGEIAPEWTASADAGAGLIAGGQFTLELTLDNDQLTVDLLMENPILYDAQYYADEMGVTLAEALARLDTQSEDAISALQSQLQTHEADTFAGLWLQHEPAYRVVVAFTRDGEETIQKYVAPDSQLAELIEIRPVEFTYAQLQADQQAVLRILDGTALSVGVGIMVMDNRVAVDVADRAAFDAALAAADTTLPESVVVTTVYQPVGETPPFAITPVPDLFMPQLKQRDVAFMDALLIGELVVEEDCLRIHDSNTDESTLVIWQADYFLNDNHGIVEIVDETGTVVARVGEMVYMGGGEQATVNNDELRESIPEQCGGPYWRMGQFLPEEYIPNVSKEWVEPTTPTPASSIPRMSVHTAQDVQRHFDEWPSAHKQRLSDDLLVIFTYPHPLGDWVGGALIYDVPSVSAVVLDFNGRFNPDLTHYEDEAGQARLEEILADTDLMQELQDEVVSRWLNPGSEGSLSVPCGQAVRAPS